MNKLCKVHGQRHPELLKITEHFNNYAYELTIHMQKEESVLFPWVRKMVKAEQQKEFKAMKKYKYFAFLGLILDFLGLIVILLVTDQRTYGIITSCVGSLIFIIAIAKWHGYNRYRLR